MLTKLLKRLRFVYKMPKCILATANAEAPPRFVEETLARLIAAASADDPLCFADQGGGWSNAARVQA